ncbi:MAG: CPBP family intramembrane metalloprotease [Anaerolinea sp.]|nr:CPBP family intramembrane metalloprotease [Anaerolinea sp.]
MKKSAVSAQPYPALELQSGHQLTLLAFAWIATLAVSNLPNILIQELGLDMPVSLLGAKLGLLAVFFALTFLWKAVQPLRRYFAIFVIFLAAEALTGWIGATPQWRAWFGSTSTFGTTLLGSQLLRLALALFMVAVLWAIYRRPRDFFLAPGDLGATAAPIRWLIDRPMSWRRLGWISALCITLGTLAFLVIFGQPSFADAGRLLPLIPFVLLFALLNAFSEELAYRASLLAPLRDAVGSTHALLLTAALFGLWHFYGVPYGVVGVIMSGALGWYLGKSMLETKGMFWAWFIHFWQDVAIFTFIALGSIVPGG